MLLVGRTEDRVAYHCPSMMHTEALVESEEDGCIHMDTLLVEYEENPAPWADFPMDIMWKVF